MTNGKKKNSVLIIDDQRDNISTLKTILGPDYTVYASTNGKDGIETANRFMPDIILLDVLMPDMDGYDVITSLKEAEKTHDIPVIFITGLDNINAEIKGLTLGAADYISKPFHPVIVKLRVLHHIQLIERIRQQTLTTKIAHNFLANAYTSTLYNDTLQMTGEFMGIAAISLYKLEINKNTLVCRNEWINPQLNLESRTDSKIELEEYMISSINDLLSDNGKDLCFISKDSVLKDLKKLPRQQYENYIATPIFIKGKMDAILVYSREESAAWSESDIGLAVLIASIFSGVFERDAIQHAEYLSRAKSEFLSRMSHEMRTPLNTIMGILQVFDLMGVPNNIKENCNVMNNAARALLRLIDDVLDISDLEYGSFSITEAAFDFKTMVWDILREADEHATKKKQLLDCRVDPSIPDSITGDKKHLKQIINTFLSNAIKFTPENGEINFNAHVINDSNNILTIGIEVSDNGIGISKEQQDRLFSVFEQGDVSLTREYGGIGIGLALSKRIIELMGGKIQLESELGKGAKFLFTFNLKK